MVKWEEYRPFREWLLDELDKREWKPIDLARRIKPEAPVDVASSISRWMRGERRPDPESCAILAEVLGADIDHVLTLAGHKPVESDGEVDERARAIAAMVRRLPDEQVGMIETMMRSLLDAQTRMDAEGEGKEPRSRKSRAVNRAAALGQSPVSLIPPSVLASLMHYGAAGAPGSRRLLTMVLIVAGAVIGS